MKDRTNTIWATIAIAVAVAIITAIAVTMHSVHILNETVDKYEEIISTYEEAIDVYDAQVKDAKVTANNNATVALELARQRSDTYAKYVALFLGTFDD